MADFSAMKLKDKFQKVVNPTTEETLSTISDAAQKMAFLASCKGIASDLRVTILSGAVTSVGTLSNIAQIGGFYANNVVSNMQNILFNAATMANIGVV